MEERLEDLAVLEARNAGKPIGDARGEIGMVAETIRYYAGGPERLLGDTIPVAGGAADLPRAARRGGPDRPVELPARDRGWKLGPALAAGNTVVLKPAELAPLTALEFEKIALDAGIPEGVVNVVAGPGSVCGKRLTEHPDVAKIAFTGSTEVGRGIAAAAAQTIKRVTLELGGKSANIVFADADLERAAASAPMAVFGNAGQDCCARSRILVERPVLDRFMEALEEAVEGVRVGDPLDESTAMGPLISAGQREPVGLVRARGRAGGDPRHGARRAGLLVPADRPVPGGHDDRAAREEIFGPVACVIPFHDEAEAVRARQRHDLRALGLDLDARRRARPTRVPRAGDRRAVGELQHLGPRVHALRRLQAVGRRPRARAPRPRPLHRGQERLHLDGGAVMAAGSREGVRDHRRGVGDRRGDRGGVRRRGSDGGRRRPGRGIAGRPGLPGRRVLRGRRQADLHGTREAFGRIDVLFNNAGINPNDDTSALDTSVEAWQRVQDVNLRGVFLCCKHGIPHLLESGGGSVINTASFVAVMGAAVSQISYTASKGGVLALSRELGVEFARRGVRVNALCPGPVATPLLLELFAKDEEQAARRMVHVPMGRFGEPREIANAALFLASDESSYVNATSFMVDGGLSGAYVTPE